MSRRANVEVLDASVVLKWFLRKNEGGIEAADEVRGHVTLEPHRYRAPLLLVYELHAGLCRRARRREIDDALQLFFAFGVRLVTPDETLLRLATELADKRGLTAYDAAYAAVARHLRGVWLTFDRPAYDRVADLGIARLLPL